MRRASLVLALVVSLVMPAAAAAQQQILLDKQARAGGLNLFQDLNDPNAFYYVPNKPRLATDANGRRQFSFLRYVENVRGTGDADAPREGEGGGIVHAVVELSVTDDLLRTAQRELQRTRPGAVIKGPVMFKSGKFGLVTSFKDPNGKLATQVVGLGNAPLLDGSKAAVSIQLTKAGAKLLWESFHTAAPDISFTFEMDIDGYLSPKRALIEADFDQIYEHQTFSAAVAMPLLAAEIRVALEDLTRKGAIKVTNIGADESMQGLIDTAYNKIVEMMFSPLNGTGTPSLASLAGSGGQGSLLDRASAMLSTERAATRAENERRRADARASGGSGSTSGAGRTTGGGSGSGGSGTAASGGAGTSAGGGGTTTGAGGAGSGTGASGTGTDPGAAGSGSGSGGRSGSGSGEAAGDSSGRPHVPLGARDRVRAPSDSTVREAGSVSDEEATERERSRGSANNDDVAEPSLAIVATFEMRRVRQRGIFRIDLNKYTTSTMTDRFDENIGDLTALLADPAHFRQINMDDPLYRQREIAVFVDGLNAQDFGQYINFVTVQMRKRHSAGDETLDEVRIDRKNFNQEGNRFSLLYGWKNDNDRSRWLEYEYRPVWSFFGGVPVEGAWQRTTAGALNMAPPFQRRTIDLQADPDAIKTAGVRAVTVKVFYTLGGVEKTKTVTLNVMKEQLSGTLEIIQPAEAADYAYEITWQLTGNRTRSSGRQTTSSGVLFVDEVPAS